MGMHWIESDDDLLSEGLALLNAAGVVLADGVERDDVEDGVLDDLAAFRSRPVSTICALCDPDDNPMFTRVWLDRGPVVRSAVSEIRACAAELCEAAGLNLREFTVFPDPGCPSTGSVRLRIGEWDVADLGYDLDAGETELDLLAAIVPSGLTAVTAQYEDLDAHSVTVFLPSGPAGEAVAEAVMRELS